jgi:hypothetical protein
MVAGMVEWRFTAVARELDGVVWAICGGCASETRVSKGRGEVLLLPFLPWVLFFLTHLFSISPLSSVDAAGDAAEKIVGTGNGGVVVMIDDGSGELW